MDQLRQEKNYMTKYGTLQKERKLKRNVTITNIVKMIYAAKVARTKKMEHLVTAGMMNKKHIKREKVSGGKGAMRHKAN